MGRNHICREVVLISEGGIVGIAVNNSATIVLQSDLKKSFMITSWLIHVVGVKFIANSLKRLTIYVIRFYFQLFAPLLDLSKTFIDADATRVFCKCWSSASVTCVWFFVFMHHQVPCSLS